MKRIRGECSAEIDGAAGQIIRQQDIQVSAVGFGVYEYGTPTMSKALLAEASSGGWLSGSEA